MSKLLIIEYDPRSGTTVPDLEIMPYAEMIVSSFNKSEKTVEIKVGSEILINAFKVLIKREALKPQDFVVKFGSEIVPMDKDGRFKSYPPGYPDTHCEILLELL